MAGTGEKSWNSAWRSEAEQFRDHMSHSTEVRYKYECIINFMIMLTSDNFNGSFLSLDNFCQINLYKTPLLFRSTPNYQWLILTKYSVLWTELQKSNAILGSVPERLIFTFNFKYFFNSSFEFQAIYWPSLLGYFTWGENFLSAPLHSFSPLPSKRIPGSCPGSIVLVNIAWKIFALTQSFPSAWFLTWLWSADVKVDFSSITRRVLLDQFRSRCWHVKILYLQFTSRTFDLRLKKALSQMVPEKERYTQTSLITR